MCIRDRLYAVVIITHHKESVLLWYQTTYKSNAILFDYFTVVTVNLINELLFKQKINYISLHLQISLNSVFLSTWL